MAETVRHRILLIEPSAIVAHGIREILSRYPEFEVIDTLPDLGHCTERLTLLSPDAVLVDPCLFDYQKRTSVRGVIPCLHEAVLVAVLTGLIDDEALRQYDGSVHLYDEPAQIVRKLRKAIDSRDEHAGIPENYELSDRENEILVAVARGMTNKEIADRYNISIHTVISHRKNIARKTGIKSVSGLTVYALLNNMIDQGDVE